jgi:hypothetical protein
VTRPPTLHREQYDVGETVTIRAVWPRTERDGVITARRPIHGGWTYLIGGREYRVDEIKPKRVVR